MNVHFYERIWMWAASGLIVIFLGAILVMAEQQTVQPPSHIEMIDPTTIADDPEFGHPGVTVKPDGSVVVVVVASMFSFVPDPIELPAHQPVTFRLTSSDVVHGFEVAGTNANAMAIPGYVSQFTITFDKPGTYQLACNEYCGILHHNMVGKVTVK